MMAKAKAKSRPRTALLSGRRKAKWYVAVEMNVRIVPGECYTASYSVKVFLGADSGSGP